MFSDHLTPVASSARGNITIPAILKQRFSVVCS